ncbi:MAG: superoxide dismutase [Luteibaculaceae bacterium]
MKKFATLLFAAAMAYSTACVAQPPYQLPQLSYSLDAFEEIIDKETMDIHYNRHHGAYVNNLNKAIQGTDAEKKSLEEIMKNISKYSSAVRNNGGGHYNHSLFWESLTPRGGQKPSGALLAAIEARFGSLEDMIKAMNSAGMGQFGSGWTWLIYVDGKLDISATPNQDNPLMDVAEKRGVPLLGIDVWEHAYYLKYQNKRGDYLEKIWEIIDWNVVAKRFEAAGKK